MSQPTCLDPDFATTRNVIRATDDPPTTSALDVASILGFVFTLFGFSLGVFGEYLARIHFRSVDRPTYFVREEREGEPPRADAQPSPSPTAAPSTSVGSDAT